MRKFLEWIKQEESGQGMVEYGVIVALVVVIGIAVFNGAGGLRGAINTLFTRVGTAIGNVPVS